MNITQQDIAAIAVDLGTSRLQILVLERENRELHAELEAAQARLELIGNPDGLHSVTAKQEAQAA